MWKHIFVIIVVHSQDYTCFSHRNTAPSTEDEAFKYKSVWRTFPIQTTIDSHDKNSFQPKCLLVPLWGENSPQLPGAVRFSPSIQRGRRPPLPTVSPLTVWGETEYLLSFGKTTSAHRRHISYSLKEGRVCSGAQPQGVQIHQGTEGSTEESEAVRLHFIHSHEAEWEVGPGCKTLQTFPVTHFL